MPVGPAKPFVSVVVPVYNDNVRLKKALEALERQSYPADRYEVLVVDNASEDDVRSIMSAYPRVKYLFEGKRGPASARNRGVREAKGEIIAFTDSDCIPRPDWIERGVAAVRSNPE